MIWDLLGLGQVTGLRQVDLLRSRHMAHPFFVLHSTGQGTSWEYTTQTHTHTRTHAHTHRHPESVPNWQLIPVRVMPGLLFILWDTFMIPMQVFDFSKSNPGIFEPVLQSSFRVLFQPKIERHQYSPISQCFSPLSDGSLRYQLGLCSGGSS